MKLTKNICRSLRKQENAIDSGFFMLTNAYCSFHETFSDELYPDVRNLQYWIASSALTARYIPMINQKMKLPENETEAIRTLIFLPFAEAKINDIAVNSSSNKTTLKTL